MVGRRRPASRRPKRSFFAAVVASPPPTPQKMARSHLAPALAGLVLLATPAAASELDCTALDGRVHMRTLYPNEGPGQLWCSRATMAQCPTTYL